MVTMSTFFWQWQPSWISDLHKKCQLCIHVQFGFNQICCLLKKKLFIHFPNRVLFYLCPRVVAILFFWISTKKIYFRKSCPRMVQTSYHIQQQNFKAHPIKLHDWMWPLMGFLYLPHSDKENRWKFDLIRLAHMAIWIRWANKSNNILSL